jgi:hypothetical protein
VDDEPGEDLGSHGVESEFEGRHDAEVPAAAAKRPEQIRVLRDAGAHQFARRGHEVDGEEVVDRQSVLPAQPAEAAAEREPRDSRRRVDPQRGRESEGLSLPIEIGEPGARLDARGPRRGIDPHRRHPRQIEHQSSVAHRVSGDVVPSAADRQEQVVPRREADGLENVRRPDGAYDRRGAPVDHRVPDRPRFVVPRLAGKEERPSEPAAQRVERLGREGCERSTNRLDHRCRHRETSKEEGPSTRRACGADSDLQ